MIALVTADLSWAPFDDEDRPPLEQSFGGRAEFVRWDDPAVDWGSYELVVLRSCWDYTARIAEFTAWLAGVAAVTRVLNPPDAVRWNVDKAYVGALARAGVPVVPTTYVGDLAAFDAAHAELPPGQVVVKPGISAGAYQTGRFERDDPAARELAATILGRGVEVLVQPYLESVGRQGETAVIHIGGEYSHAVRKGPILGPDGTLMGGEYTEVIDRVDPPADWLAAAESVLAARATLAPTPEPLLYSRVDLVAGAAGEPLCLELEIIEPSLFFPAVPEAAARFTAATLSRVGR